MQRAKRSKGQNVIEVHSRLGHLKNISHPSLFSEEGASCLVYFPGEKSVLFHSEKFGGWVALQL